ncbi:High-affinity glucose transporter [Elsinoe australis]|uniref:High-affinity glucose transporter n=1 Tax=Elsinoe australis TaxID=40998 RepID=A0A2P8A031_9PEZI|nr:High-affinity glucose transporter [Elsinoe australis]
MKPGVYQFLVGSFAALGSFLFGYDLAVIAEVVASDDFTSRFLQTSGSTRSGTVVALFTAGCFFGAFAAGYTRRIGRRGVIFFACCIFVVGGIVQTAAVVIGMLYAGRFIAGLGVGLLTMIIPIFQAEISHRRIRGRITSLQQLFNAFGQVWASWIGYGCYMTWRGTGNSSEWRIPLGIQMVPAFVLGGLIYLFPESPRWLCDNGHSDKGLRNLARLHSHGDETDPYVVAEYELIHNQIADEQSQKRVTYLDLFRDWGNLRRMIIVTMIQAECQMTGVSAIQYFSPQIYAQIGIATSQSLMFNGINAIIAFAGTATCILVVDKIGRRPLEIWGAAIMCATFIVNANLIKAFPATDPSNAAHWAFVALTWLFNYVFFVTSGPLSWAIPAELFGTAALRMKGVSVGAMTSFAFNTMIGQVTPVAVAAIGWKYYLVFIICNATNGLFFWAFLPETKGLNLEDMDELFHESPTFVPGSNWLPSSHIDQEADAIRRRECVKGDGSITEQVEDISQV